jgi:hypothetical protein
MLFKHRHPLTPKNPTGNTIPPNQKPQKHFAITATLNTQKSAFSHDSSPIVRPPDFRSTAIDVSQTPAPFDAEQPDRKYISPQRQASKHFAITATLNTQESAFFHDSSLIVCPIDLRSTAIDAFQTPAPSDAEQPDRKYYSP